MGMWGGCNQPGIIQPGCGGSSWTQILFSMCSFFFFSGLPRGLQNLNSGTKGLSLGDGQWKCWVLTTGLPREFSGLKLEGDAKGQQEENQRTGFVGDGGGGTVEGCWPSNLTAQPCSFHPHWVGGEGVVQSAQTWAPPACSTHYVRSAFLDLAVSKLDES